MSDEGESREIQSSSLFSLSPIDTAYLYSVYVK